ncbi:MAG: DUF2383 domain-containing protein [Chloroflexi bacterium]|nr:DUF2383 domain-containing protein [Chloroflexota bacterium]
MNPSTETVVRNDQAPASNNLLQTLTRLIESCIESDKTLYSTAEQLDNRGMKLLVKSYAQQHARFTGQLQDIVKQMGDTPPENRDAAAAVGQGLNDVKAAMMVKLQGRHHAALLTALQNEDKTVAAYEAALQAALPERMQTLITQQAERVRNIQRQLQIMTGETARQLVVRLYNQPGEAERVLDQLQRAGFTSDEIYTAPIEQAATIYRADTQQRGRSKSQTVLAMGLAGAGFGLALGLLAGIFQNLLAPNTVGFLPAGGLGAIMIVGLLGAVIGAIFGLIFGLLIGQNNAEDDAYLYTESLKDGDTLLVVFTDSRNKAEADRIVGLKNQREIAPKPA